MKPPCHQTIPVPVRSTESIDRIEPQGRQAVLVNVAETLESLSDEWPRVFSIHLTRHTTPGAYIQGPTMPSVEELRAQIVAVGDEIKALKASGAAKDKVQPHVDNLLGTCSG